MTDDTDKVHKALEKRIEQLEARARDTASAERVRLAIAELSSSGFALELCGTGEGLSQMNLLDPKVTPGEPS